jgi:hypothetical protein
MVSGQGWHLAATDMNEAAGASGIYLDRSYS